MTKKSENDENNYSILIVDDIPENLQILSEILSKKGVEIAFSLNGKKAIESLSVHIPDLVLLDIKMPGMDGFEVCRIIKENPETRNIPVIFLTARNESEDIVKGLETGAVDYVTKPFIAAELISRVFTHLRLKKVQDSITRQNEELRELIGIKDKFFSIMAHDLKSPFNGIIGFSDLLLENFSMLKEKEITEYLGYINSSSKQMYKLLENLLEWARLQTDKISYSPSEISLNGLVVEIINLMEHSAKSKNIIIKNCINEDIYVSADPYMLKAVLRNLISNAIKFTKIGGMIIVDTDISDNKNAIISVSDNGIGICREDMDKIFRIDAHISRKGTCQEEGTGLGLVLCKEFTEKNGGKIWVNSIENEGTEFKFTVKRV